MATEFRESMASLEKQIQALEGEKRASAERLAVQNINALRTFLDAAIGWFRYPEDEETVSTGDSRELDITCPQCGNPIKVRLSKSK